MTITAIRTEAERVVSRIDFDALVRNHRQRITELIYRLCGNWADAEEAVQDALIDMWGKRQQFNDVTDPAGWLYMHAKFKVRQIRHKNAKQVPGLCAESIDWFEERPADGPGNLPCLGEPETAARVRKALAILPPQQRRVVEMHCLQGMSTAEIAVRIGRCQDNVGVLVRTALRRSDWSGPEWREPYAHDPEAEALRSQTSILMKLRPRTREAVRLRYVDGHRPTEVAARMGVPVGTVKSWINDARKVARAELAKVEAKP
jgi:RNA polymerase sigma-70 factor (ECF subfamily)